LLVSDYLNEIKENSGKYEILMQGSTPRTQITVVLTITPYFCLGTRYRWVAKKCSSGTMNLYQFVQLLRLVQMCSMDKPEVFNKTSTVGFMSLHLFYKKMAMYFTRIII
jgi:hypothetical protein